MTLAPLDPVEATPEQLAFLERVPPIALMRLIARLPILGGRIAALGGAVMNGRLDPALRELLAIRVGRNLGSDYVAGQHRRLSRAIGIDPALIAQADGAAKKAPRSLSDAVIDLADCVSDCRPIGAATQLLIVDELGEDALIELLLTAAYFMMLSGITTAAALELEPQPEGAT